MDYNVLDYEPTPNGTMATRLQTKFTGVPNVTLEDSIEWVNEAINLHGYEVYEELPIKDRTLVLLLAQSVGARSIALKSAQYFKYQDGDESVDKTMIVEQYRAIANDYLQAYLNAKSTLTTGNGNGAYFTIAKRADR